MTELDFDELDKAVNSLMGDVDTSKRNPGLDDPEDNVVTLTTAEATPAAPAASVSAVSASQTSADSSLAVKRRGQFMDVIHPSSDMKATPAKVNRQGASVEPTTAVTMPESPQPAVATDALAEAAVSSLDMESTGTAIPPVAQTTATPDAPIDAAPAATELPKSDWPDPIDLAMQDEEPIKATEAVSSTEPAPESAATVPSDTSHQESGEAPSEQIPTEVVDEVAQPAVDAPLSSPFLPDAKVEKRPLGMPVPVELEQQLEPAPSPTEQREEETSPANEAESQINPVVPLPSELQSDILALESSNSQPIAEATTATQAETPTVGVESMAVGGSIPQQYQEQQRSSTGDSTPIYDTSTHTQPLEKPKKKKSPLVLVVVVLVLALVGGLAGAAYYYFTH